MSPSEKVIAFEGRLKGCRNVITLGVRPNYQDYSPDERAMIRSAPKIYYPSSFYADLFDAMNKTTFPSYHTYKCVQDKIKQTALLQMLEIPHPKTRVFYGKRQKQTIQEHFSFPFVAKIPRGSAMGRGVYLIRNQTDLDQYLKICHPAYIQQYLATDRDIRVVVIGRRIVHAYWRLAPKDTFKSNIAAGGKVSLDPIPEEALSLALTTARCCEWDDVGIDILAHGGKYYVIEANMKYGKEGFRQAGIDYLKLMEQLIADGEI